MFCFKRRSKRRKHVKLLMKTIGYLQDGQLTDAELKDLIRILSNLVITGSSETDTTVE